LLYHCKAARDAAYRLIEGSWMPSKDRGSAGERQHRSWNYLWLVALVLAVASSLGCNVERRKSDAELGLNPQQAAGRRIYDAECDRCHEPYSTRGKKGPGLKGMFKHKYLSLSGLPANDERVADIIRLGRNEMPAFSQKLDQQDLENLLAYLHTL
jgi:mono/diheme cytochrome c family protein